MRKTKKDVGESPFLPLYGFVYSNKNGTILDVAPSVRLFVGDGGINEMRNRLPLRSKELLLWVMMRLRSGEDTVLINRETYMLEMGIESPPTFRKALQGLIDANILAKTIVKNRYFVNAVHFFRGSRINKWPQCSKPYGERKTYTREELINKTKQE